MPDTVKSFTDITKDYPYLLSKIKSMWKRIIQIGKLINSWVSWYESRLKRSENIILLQMIENLFKNSSFKKPPQMCIKEKQVDSSI